jgi:AraC-like DNA-binding protein
MNHLSLNLNIGIEVVCCGLFISSGKGTHPDRVLDNYELIVVRKGTLSIFEEGVRFDVPPEHALLLHPGRRHRGATPFGRDLSFYWIHFVVSKQRRVSPPLVIPQFTRVLHFESVVELFHRHLENQEARQLEPILSAAALLQILCEIARKPLELSGVRGTVLAGRVESYVTNHLAEKLSTAKIARALRANPDYLNRVFRRVKGMTVTEYIHHRKLTDAAGMLRESTDAIAEVAAACGYLSVGHFRRMFQRLHGVAPRVYRRLMARAFVNAR